MKSIRGRSTNAVQSVSLIAMIGIKRDLAMWSGGSAVQYSTVQYSTVQYKAVQYSTTQYSEVQYRAVQYITVQSSTVHNSTVKKNVVQYSSLQSRHGRQPLLSPSVPEPRQRRGNR